MAIKQRKGKRDTTTNSNSKGDDGYNADKDKKPAKNKTNRPYRVKKKVSLAKILLTIFFIISLAMAVLYHYYSKYGPAIIFGQGLKDFDWTPYRWRKFIDDNDKTILVIGGPHRSGTTVIWEAIKAHPEIVGFGSRFETGVDYSEGVLLQEVYPRFGVGLEFKKNFGVPGRAKGGDTETQDGLGRYALLPHVHWTKENKKDLLENPNTLSKLLNRFAPYWDKTIDYGEDGLQRAKVWVEKSPQNGVLSTFLEGLYNMPVLANGTVDLNAIPRKKTCTKFLYMTRHPIANTYAVDKFVREAMGGYIDFEILFRNYVKLHEYMFMDKEAMDSPAMWAKLEDFAWDPEGTLTEIFKFLDVASDPATVKSVLDKVGEIKSNPNEKYLLEWCTNGRKEHGDLLDRYRQTFKELKLGYDLDFCDTLLKEK
jgi:hypothetical protein